MTSLIRAPKKAIEFSLVFHLAAAGLCAGELNRMVEDTLKSAGFENARWSISVKEAHNGRDVFSFNENLALIPASIMKLLVTSAGLDLLGPDRRFRTRLYTDGDVENGVLRGDLYVRGGGDPSFGSSLVEGAEPLEGVFGPWIEALKKKKIRKVKGIIYGDDSAFTGIEISPSWAWEDIGNYYAAWPSALTINDNLYRLCFAPSEKVGGEAKLRYMSPFIYGLEFINLMGTGPDDSGDNGYIFNMPKNYKAILRGTLPRGFRKFCIKGAIPDPALFAVQYFREELEKNNVELEGWVKTLDERPDYSGKEMIAETVSPPLRNIIKITNTKSFNLYAEILLRHLSVEKGGDGSLRDGLGKMREYLAQKEIDAGNARFEDACGLSRLNKVPAQLFSGLLAGVYAGEHFFDFYESLVSPGENGAKGHIRSFGTGTYLEKNLKIKSGSLSGVRAYAGYLKTRSKKTLAFCFIINNYEASPRLIDDVHEKLLLKLSEY